MGLLRIASTARTCATSLLIRQASSSASATGAMVDLLLLLLRERDDAGTRWGRGLWKERKRDYMSKGNLAL